MKVNCAEGTCFAVPLRTGGFAVGLVARASSDGPHVLAYFFGPKRDHVPTMAEVGELRAQAAAKVARTGDLHLLDGRWPVIGRLRDFHREDWPFPKFLRADEITRRAWAVEYADGDPGRAIAQTPIAFGTAGLERDASLGAGAAELVLTKLLVDADDHIAPRELAKSPDGKPRRFRHFIYIPDRVKGEALAARLQRDGFEVESRMGADATNWLVLVHHMMVPDEQAIDELRKQFRGLAEALGGEYDGWEAEV
jgi:hypothetical protein